MYVTKTNQSLNKIFDTDPDLVNDDDDVVTDLVPIDDNTQFEQDQLMSNSIENENIKKTIEEDFDDARNNIKGLIEKGNDLLDMALALSETEDPKAIDSATKLIGQLSSLNSKLLDLTSRKQEVLMKARVERKEEKQETESTANTPQQITNNNAIFVGSSQDLMKLILETRKNNETTT